MVVAIIVVVLGTVILFEIVRVAQLTFANFVDKTQHQWQLEGAINALRKGFDVLLHGSCIFVLIIEC